MASRPTIGKPPSQRTDRRLHSLDAPAPSLAQIKPERRALWADVVHKAVCDHTRSDGFGHCYLYAYGCWVIAIANGFTGGAIEPQAGTLMIQPDPAKPDHWFALESSEGGMDRGEFHAVCVARDGTMIDLSARHYRRYAESLAIQAPADATGTPATLEVIPADQLPAWNQPQELPYLWTRFDALPDWVRYRTDPIACDALARRIAGASKGAELTRFRERLLSDWTRRRG